MNVGTQYTDIEQINEAGSKWPSLLRGWTEGETPGNIREETIPRLCPLASQIAYLPTGKGVQFPNEL